MFNNFFKKFWSGNLPLPAILAILLFVSLMVRLPLSLAVTNANMPMRGDEGGYYERAEGFSHLLKQFRTLKSEQIFSLIEQIYGGGRWGPVHPFLLSAGINTNEESPKIQNTRIVMALISVLTTGLLFLLTRRIFNHKSALITAGLHIFSTRFVGFSVLLWSETTFIFVTTAAFFVSSFLRDERSRKAHFVFAIGVGFLWGLAAMTRPIAIGYIVITVLWAAYIGRSRFRRLIIPIVILVFVAITVFPWELAIYQANGRIQLLATTGNLNLFRANVPNWTTEEEVREFARENDLDKDDLMRKLAIEEIVSNPIAALERGIKRNLAYWHVDAFLFKHLLRGVFPPLPPIFVIAWYVFALVVYLTMLISAGVGLLASLMRKNPFSVLLVLVMLSNLIYPMILKGGNLRFAIVNLALLLPLIGYGILQLRQVPKTRLNAFSILSLFFFPAIVIYNVPKDITPSDLSSIYLPVYQPINSLLDKDLFVVDLLAFDVSPDIIGPLKVRVIQEEYFLNEPGTKLVIIDGQEEPGKRQVDVMVFAYDANQRPTLEIINTANSDSALIDPATMESWNTWIPTGLEGVRVRWIPNTSNSFPPKEAK